MPLNFNENKTYTQLDGPIEIKNTWHTADSQVSFSTSSTTGTITVEAKYHPDADFEVIFESDGVTPLIIDLTSLKTFQLLGKWVYSYRFTPSNVDATYTPCLASGYFQHKY